MLDPLGPLGQPRWVSTLFFFGTRSQLPSYVHSLVGALGPGGNQLFETASKFSDPSYALYTLYNERSAELDRQLVSGWSEHVRDLMVLVRYTSSRRAPRVLVLIRLFIDRVAFSRRQFLHSSHSLT